MCKEIEKVLTENSEEVQGSLCTVTMDGKESSSDDFVAILSRETGDASIYYNTDALTLGMAMKMVAKCFTEAMHQLPESERAEVAEILGDAFVLAQGDMPNE